MSKHLMIRVSSGEVLHAELLEELAPATCAALAAALPYQNRTLGHGKFSGHALYMMTDLTLRKSECSRSYGVCPGDILYNPHVVDAAEHPNELIVVYGPAAIRNVAGFGSANLCARIRHEDLPLLYRLGIDINRHGERPATISLEEGAQEHE